MIRRRPTPWIHKWSRPLIGAIAACGTLNTVYLTFEKLTGGNPVCNNSAGIKGCTDVLSSPWATIFGQPLPLFGALAYISMLVLALIPLALNLEEKNPQRKKWENTTWWLLFCGAIAMSVFSAYLMYVLAFQLKAVCFYCISSALFSLTMLILTVIGHEWEDIGQILFSTVIVGMITLIGTLGIYSGVGVNTANISNTNTPQPISFVPSIPPIPGYGWDITTQSGPAEIALAQHIAQIEAKEYVAYWCPHCHEQKLLFGKEAYKIISDHTKVECASDSPNSQTKLCIDAKIQSFPTWIIKGKSYSGVQNLAELAKITGYSGPSNFRYLR